MATAKKPKPAGPATSGLRVIARNPQGIRRGGRHWPAEATTVSLAELTEEQVEAVKAEPALIVDDVDMPA